MNLERLRRAAAQHPDLVVFGAWWALVALLGFSRKDFTGDGLRHLPPILESARPRLGEPRWLLFPALLFVLLRPLVATGMVTSVEGLTRPMMAATVAAAGLYLWALRACLVALGVAPLRRAAGLALAGASAALLLIATDLMEPLFAAAFAVVGLALVARRAGAPAAGVEQQRRAVLAGVAIIAAASLFYQGVILAVGLIPMLAPRRALWHAPTLVAAAAILAAVPVVSMGLLLAAGNSAGHALARIAQGEENPLYRTYLKKTGPAAYLVALLAGPPQGVVTLPDFHGFNGLIAALRGGAQRRWALELLARLGFAGAVVAAGVAAAARRRDFTLLLGLGALLLLPLVRHQQYGYLKYYILLPVVLAVAGARAPAAATAAIALVLLAANGGPLLHNIRRERRFYADRVAAYAQARPSSCWLTAAWAPSVSFRWPGRVCPVLGTLAGGTGEDPDALIAANHAALTRCLEECFCRSSGVFTDDMTEQGGPLVADSARHFDYSEVDLPALVIPRARARRVSPDPIIPVYAYPPEEQQRLCRLIAVRSAP